MLSQPQFWVAVVQIVWIDLVLSGDNAVVIAMACRDLPARERRWGMIIGAGSAAVLLVAFALIVSALLRLPWLRVVAACILIFIAVKLLDRRPDRAADTVEAARGLWRAVGLVVAADVGMSFDNAFAVAAVANGRYVLLALGLAISIPIVVAGSAIVLALMQRFPIIVWAGAAILGWVAGELLVSDPVVAPHVSALVPAIFGADSAVSTAARSFESRTGLSTAGLALSLLGVALVLTAGAMRRRAGRGD
jgi:YjbE family integral membrane protein